MSKDGTNRGGARPGAGRKPKAISEKIASGNPGGRPLTVVDFGSEAAHLAGSEMPPVKDYLKAKQKDGSVTCAEEVFEETWEWLKKIGCHTVVSPQVIERYAMCAARWIQCEQMTNELGFLSKHPTTGKPIPSPFINIGINYMNQAVRSWNEIYQIVKENCTVDYSGKNPQDDLMEKLLASRRGI